MGIAEAMAIDSARGFKGDLVGKVPRYLIGKGLGYDMNC